MVDKDDVDTELLSSLTQALERDDEVTMVDQVRALLGDGALIAVWRPTAAGWRFAHGDALDLPSDALAAPGVVQDGQRRVVRVGTDPTAARLLVLTAPAQTDTTVDVVASLLRISLGRLVERRATANARQRLADNERIGQLGSYDWHVPTDTNRWSDELYRIYGEEPQSFNASYDRFIEFIHPDDRDKVRAIHERAFETGEPYEMEERIVLANGTERLLWSNGEVVMGPDGAPERFIGICRDVTDERAAEQAAATAEHHRRLANDAEIRRRAALELNDVVVQGLTAAAWATDIGAEDVASEVLADTLENARSMMDDLLLDGGVAAPVAGELRRTTAPASQIPPDRAPAPPTASTAPPSEATRRRVVLADDAPDVRMLLTIQLEQMGFEVVGTAADGLEAVAMVEAHDPDVVLLDLSMPRMDGLEATVAIRTARPDATIVIISGYAAHTMQERAREAGADAYIEKGRDLPGKLAPVLAASA